MLEGPTENPITVENLPQNSAAVENKSNLNVVQEAQDRMDAMASGVTGGATEQGLQQGLYKIQLLHFLKEKVGLNLQQISELPNELQTAINEFNPENRQELDTQFGNILQRLIVTGNLRPDQQKIISEFKKAIVDDGLLKAEAVFQALQQQIKEANITDREKVEANKELSEFQEDLKNPDELKLNKSLQERIPKVVRWVGLGGLAMLLLSLWRAFKETMGLQNQG